MRNLHNIHATGLLQIQFTVVSTFSLSLLEFPLIFHILSVLSVFFFIFSAFPPAFSRIYLYVLVFRTFSA